MKRTLITSALPYANGYIHLGHCAGAYLPADIYARWLRLRGHETLYVCGSDEHGVAITIAADKEKVSPDEIIDKYHTANSEAFAKFGMTFDIYSRTSFPLHHKNALEFFDDFLEKGLLSEKEEEQFYDPKANMFLPDRYVEGECPNCGSDHARGDQCDSCGAYYDQLELKNPKSLVSGDTPIVRKTTHWYMKFDVFQSFLEEYIEKHSDWKDNVLQQTRSWLKQGLSERAITRDLKWGVSLEKSKKLPKEKTEGKALYVWFEAVLGYISATQIWAKNKEIEGHGKASDWKKWWQSPDSRYIAFIGKDNIVFHTIIFPAILHARGNGYILPDNVPANEFLNLEGRKFSKSRNWSIDLRDFINDFPAEASMDALRYTLALGFPETRDSDFTWKDFQARNNNELSAIFGNFVNRSLQFLQKNYNREIPMLSDGYKALPSDWNALSTAILQKDTDKINTLHDLFTAKYSENDFVMISALADGISKISDCYNRFHFRDGVNETMNIARAANKYFNDEEPWKTFKNDSDRSAKTLFVCCQIVNSLAILFAPITPYTSNRISHFLNQLNRNGSSNVDKIHFNVWEEAALPKLLEGTITKEPEILFPKVEDSTIDEQVAKLGRKEPEVVQPVEDEKITIDYFKKIKLKTATVVQAEKVNKSKKLLRLVVDIEGKTRQILAGISEHYAPEELIGKTVVVVANLEPAKLMGMESNGMLLAANSGDGSLSIVIPEKKSIGSGAEVR